MSGHYYSPEDVYRFAIRHNPGAWTNDRVVFWQDTIHAANRHGVLTNDQTEELLGFLQRQTTDARRGRRR